MDFSDKKVTSTLMFLILFIQVQILMPGLSFSNDKQFKNSAEMEFVLISQGTFTMGSPSNEVHRDKNETQHEVNISKPFYMQTTEVTLGQWRKIMGKKLFGGRGGGKNLPKVKVSWFDSMRFIEKLNKLNEGVYRLPTEAEWEYAARAGTQGAYHWGNTIDCAKAAYSNNSLKSGECIKYAKSRGFDVDKPFPVKSYPPNQWGLYDMHGNVWEWCFDWYGPYPRGKVVDPRGPETGKKKVRRGGSWFKDGWLCRSANRNSGHPGSKYQTLGFRVVMEVK